MKLFLSQCSSLYGSSIWRLDDKQLEVLITTWNICCRRLLGLPSNTRTYVLPYIMNSTPIKYIVMSRILNFFISGLKHDCPIISMLFKNVLISKSTYMTQNVFMILKVFNIKYCDIFDMNKNQMLTLIQNGISEPEWRSETIQNVYS